MTQDKIKKLERQMDENCKHNIRSYNKALDVVGTLFPKETIELVGSFALYLSGLLTFDEVKDLDVVVNVSREKFENMLTAYAMTIMHSDVNTRTKEYINCVFGDNIFRIGIISHGVHVCVFIKDETTNEYIKDLHLDYRGFKIQPLKEIFKNKKLLNRKKDIEFFKDFNKNFLI